MKTFGSCLIITYRNSAMIVGTFVTGWIMISADYFEIKVLLLNFGSEVHPQGLISRSSVEDNEYFCLLIFLPLR